MQNKKSSFKYPLIIGISLAVVCVALFLFLMIRISYKGNFDFDYCLIDFSSKINSRGLTAVFKVLTHFGSMITIAILAVVMAIACKPIWVKMFSVVNVGFVALFCFVVKHIVKRPRPEGIALINETGYSFPSAHTMGSVVFYGFLIFLIWKYLKNKPVKITLTIFLSIFAMLIGYTRVYLGVHYASDVLAGILAGVTYLVVSIIMFLFLEKKIKFIRRNNEEK